MSDQPRRPRSGEFTNLTSQRAKDGTLEYVLGDESSSPLEDISPPRTTASRAPANHQKDAPASRAPLVLGVGVFVASVVAAIAFFASGGEEHAEQAPEEQASFKAYSGNAAPADTPPLGKKAPAPAPVVDDEIPEELAGWDLDETDEEVIVIEEYDGEEEPAAVVVQEDVEPALGQPYTKEQDGQGVAAHGRERFASPEQRKLLRQFNEQLDRGERPIIPKANMPSTLRPISPRMQNLDNITGPKFLPGKLHKIDKIENAEPME